MMIKKGDTILFQGDSVTDALRSEDMPLGRGYPYFVEAAMTAAYPEMDLKFINRGVSGNRVSDLKARWQAECIDIQPDILSILIGVNDTWRRYDSNTPRTAEEFKSIYREILTEAREKTSAKIIMMEPFILHQRPGMAEWREDLNPKITAVRELALEFGIPFIPLDGIFTAAASRAPMEKWTFDGVHPTAAGHALIAKAWMDCVKSVL